MIQKSGHSVKKNHPAKHEEDHPAKKYGEDHPAKNHGEDHPVKNHEEDHPVKKQKRGLSAKKVEYQNQERGQPEAMHQ